MSDDIHTDDLSAVVRYALETTRATTHCPFHHEVIIRVGDDAAESHAFERAKRVVKSDGTTWCESAPNLDPSHPNLINYLGRRSAFGPHAE